MPPEAMTDSGEIPAAPPAPTAPNAPTGGDHLFPPTRWSRVRRYAEGTLSGGARQALEELCRDYWFPLYAYTRRLGSGVEDAQDLVQGFFESVIEKKLFRIADPEKGRLRSFLLKCFRNFCSSRIHEGTGRNRRRAIFVDWEQAEQALSKAGDDRATPEEAYDQQWAVQMLSLSVAELQREFEAAGRGELFARLRPFLSLDAPEGSTAAVAQELGMSQATLRQAVHRLRLRYGATLRRLIADTLENPEKADVDREMEMLRLAVRDRA